jgi:AcrR family transcriptional regulator
MATASADRKEWEKAQREQRIVEIAREVFLDRGFEKTTIPAVADATGYNRRTIYLYFKDKEDLFLAAVLHCLSLLRDRLARAAEKIPEGDTGLKAFARAFFGFANDYPGFMDLIMVYESRHFVYHESEREQAGGARKQACQQVSQQMADMATAALKDAVEKGLLNTQLPPRALMLVIWGQMLGVLQVLRIRKAHFKSTFGIDPDELIDRFIQMMAASLIPPA